MSSIVGEVWGGLRKIPDIFLNPGRFGRGVREIVQAVGRIMRRLLRREQRPVRRDDGCGVHLPPEVYKRPDPLIYAQHYLMKMGLAVTWDNPDIQLFELDSNAPDGVGAPVSSSALKPEHAYKVRVRVWNGSYDAPAVGLPVYLSYLSFGAGTTSTAIGMMPVELGVKGSPHHPAFALFDWKTPAAGHYCLQARLEWGDDSNPDNNLGQENVDVGVLHSPAAFTFALHNPASVRRRFVLQADTYQLPELAPCDDPERPGRGNEERPPTRLAESRSRWERARREQAYGAFPVPEDWTVAIEPGEIVLAAGEERLINISIEPRHPDAVVPKAFNIHAFAQHEPNILTLAGGVTLYVTRS